MQETVNNPLIKDTVLGSKYLDPVYLSNHFFDFLSYVFTNKTLGVVYTILSILSILSIAIVIYTTIRMFEIRRKEHRHMHHEIEEYAHHQALKEKEKEEDGVFKNNKWKKVLDYIFSDNQNDWKLAIIEADSMLFDMLAGMGYEGDTLGDKLKDAGNRGFKNINSAWEAHNVRNKIAHEGSAFEISSHEAKRIVSIYESIFQEFGFI